MTRLRLGKLRLFTVLGFLLACGVFTAYMYAQAGGSVPGFSAHQPYTVTVDMADVGNVVKFSDVQVAGVPVGKVQSIEQHGPSARVVLALEENVAPLHGIPKVQPTEKALTGQWAVAVTDGHGATVPNGSTLPAAAAVRPVTLRDVLADLDAPTRASLSGTIRSLDAGTAGRTKDIGRLMRGMANLGRDGHTALDAIAAQTGDLKALTRELNTVFTALDTSQGRFADVVGYASRLSGATAGQRQSLEAAMRKMPGVLDSAQTAAGKLGELSGELSPVAGNLRASAPALSSALHELPGAAKDLRASLPSLNGALDRAPTTLDRVPQFGDDVTGMLPPATGVLRDLNPALRYLEPYGQELAHAVTNFGASFHYKDASGSSMLRLLPVITAESAKPLPFDLAKLPGVRETGLIQNNPYPAPGSLTNQVPFSGPYPRVQRDGP